MFPDLRVGYPRTRGGFLNGRQESDADLFAVNPCEFATSISEAVEESSKKNSFDARPSIEPLIVNLAPVAETSFTVH